MIAKKEKKRVKHTQAGENKKLNGKRPATNEHSYNSCFLCNCFNNKKKTEISVSRHSASRPARHHRSLNLGPQQWVPHSSGSTWASHQWLLLILLPHMTTKATVNSRGISAISFTVSITIA